MTEASGAQRGVGATSQTSLLLEKSDPCEMQGRPGGALWLPARLFWTRGSCSPRALFPAGPVAVPPAENSNVATATPGRGWGEPWEEARSA